MVDFNAGSLSPSNTAVDSVGATKAPVAGIPPSQSFAGPVQPTSTGSTPTAPSAPKAIYSAQPATDKFNQLSAKYAPASAWNINQAAPISNVPQTQNPFAAKGNFQAPAQNPAQNPTQNPNPTPTTPGATPGTTPPTTPGATPTSTPPGGTTTPGTPSAPVQTPQQIALQDQITASNQAIESQHSYAINALQNSVTQNDQGLTKTVQDILSSFSQLRDQQITANNAAMNVVRAFGIRTGSSEHEPLVQNQLVSQEATAGINRLAALDAKQQKAIDDARQAIQDKDLNAALKADDITSKIIDEKRAAANDLKDTVQKELQNTIAQAQEKRAQDQADRQAAADKLKVMTDNMDVLAKASLSVDDQGNVTTPDLATIQREAAAAGITDIPRLVNAFNQAKMDLQGKNSAQIKTDLEIAKLRAENLDQGLSSDSKDFYALKARGGLPAGVNTPADYTQYLENQKAAAAEKAKVAAANDPNMPISDSLAIANGLPPGTTQGEAAKLLKDTVPPALNPVLDKAISRLDSSPQAKAFVETQTRKQEVANVEADAGLTGKGAADYSLLIDYIRAKLPTLAPRNYELQTIKDYANSNAQNLGLKFDRIGEATGFLTDDSRKTMEGVINAAADANATAYNKARNNEIQTWNQRTGRNDGELLIKSSVYSPEEAAAQQTPKTPEQQITDFGQKNPDKQQALNDIVSGKTPKADGTRFTKSDISDWMNAQGGGSFNSVGSDTKAAAPIASQDGVDAYGSQNSPTSSPSTILKGMQVITNTLAPDLKKFADNCVFFARQFVPNIPSGATSVAGRMEGLKQAQAAGYGGFGGTDAQVGDALHTSEGDVGHTPVIIGESGNNWILEEANYKTGQITQGRQISKNDPKILGWIRPKDGIIAKNSPNEGTNDAIQQQMDDLISQHTSKLTYS